MKRFLPLLICAAFALNCIAAQRQPNIIVFLVDDMGVMDTSVPFLTEADGKPKRYPLNDFFRTPNLERLASDGVRFNNFCANSLCSPSRVSLMTGQSSARHRVTTYIEFEENNRGKRGPQDWNWTGLKRSDVALPRLLQGGGYRTIHVGKGHFGPNGSDGADPRNLGFDVSIAGDAHAAPASYHGAENYGNPINGKKHRYAGGSTGPVPGLQKYFGTDTFLTDALTIEANALVDDAVKDGKPFFLYLAHYAVHSPFNHDPRFAPRYQKSGSASDKLTANYAGLVEGVDKSLGELRAHLESLGVAEDTLIIFLGDNGTEAPLGHHHAVACAEPLRGKKATHYEGGVRVPFVVAWAKTNANNPNQQRLAIPANMIQPQLGVIHDLFPTVLQIAGVAGPTNHVTDGSSLLTLFAGKRDTSRWETFLLNYPHEHRSSYFTSFRDGDWKVIYHYFQFPTLGGKSHYELFNLANDLSETNNLAASHPAELRRLMQELIAAMNDCNANYPVDEAGKPLKPKMPE